MVFWSCWPGGLPGSLPGGLPILSPEWLLEFTPAFKRALTRTVGVRTTRLAVVEWLPRPHPLEGLVLIFSV